MRPLVGSFVYRNGVCVVRAHAFCAVSDSNELCVVIMHQRGEQREQDQHNTAGPLRYLSPMAIISYHRHYKAINIVKPSTSS